MIVYPQMCIRDRVRPFLWKVNGGQCSLEEFGYMHDNKLTEDFAISDVYKRQPLWAAIAPFLNIISSVSI